MKLKEFDITIDIKKRNKTNSIEIAQNDIETNVLNITLVNDEKEYETGDKEVEIAFKKPNKSTIIQSDITNAGNKIRCVLERETIDIPGKVLGEIRILDDDFILTSSQFEFYVRQVIKWT